jgi:hypothetical protein
MPLKKFVYKNKEYQVVTINNAVVPPYRKKLTDQVTAKYSTKISGEKVAEVLDFCFEFYVDEMTTLLRSINDHCFFFFVFNLHEQTSQLSYLNQENYQIPVDYKYYAAYRRILKMILQESCFCNCDKANAPTPTWMARTIDTLEKLIYLGDGILMKVDAIALEKMVGGSVEITFEDGLITFTNSPEWEDFIPLFHDDFPEQNNNSIIDENLQKDFDRHIEPEFGITLEMIGALIYHFEEALYNQDPPRFCTMDELKLIFKQQSESPYTKDFIAGLVLNKDNASSLKSSVYSAYKGDRIIHRPILTVNIDDTVCILAGFYSYHEALNTFFQNNITLGKMPTEWDNIPFIQDLRKQFRSRHKDILENPVEKLLQEMQVPHDRNIITLNSWKHKDNLSINKSPGEIDFIFILDRKIYIADCKNLTKRYEMHGYRQDISKFLPYESKMTEKLEFLQKNRSRLETHLKIKLSTPEMDLSSHQLEGIFIINTPTIPMINGKYKIYSFHNFQMLLDGDDYFEKKVFLHDQAGTEIGWPYIDSYKAYLNSLS